jgi:hypothetical protein
MHPDPFDWLAAKAHRKGKLMRIGLKTEIQSLLVIVVKPLLNLLLEIKTLDKLKLLNFPFK